MVVSRERLAVLAMLTETTTCRAGEQEILWALKCTLNCHNSS